MKSFRLLLAALLPLATLAGCATGPQFSQYSATIQPPAATDGRIWFYRPSKFLMGAVQPHVFLNDVIVGKAQPGCYFFADRPPGDYEIKCSTEWASKFIVHLEAGDEKFVRLTLGPGVVVGHVIPAEIDKARGLDEIAECKLITADGANAELRGK